MKPRTLIISVIVLCYILAAGMPAAGVEGQKVPEKLKESVVAKTVTGTASGVSSNFIAVEYGVSEKEGAALEMAFDVAKGVKINNRKSLKEIKMGDTVSVDYVEITKTNAKGERVSCRRVAKVVSFLRPAAKAVESEVLGAGAEDE